MTDKDIEIINEKLKKFDDEELTTLVHELIKQNMQLLQACTIDPMTGIYNRRILEDNLKNNAVMLCDIDDFKSINDIYGHDKGDFVIKEIAKILKNSFRKNDYVCRFGGDEFLILFNDSEYEFIKQRCEHVNNEIKNRIQLPGRIVTLSIGIYINNLGQSLEFAIKKADEALYESKNNGKNQVIFYNDNITKIKR